MRGPKHTVTPSILVGAERLAVYIARRWFRIRDFDRLSQIGSWRPANPVN